MTTIEEQEARHEATMDFFKSGKQLAEEIAIELNRIEAEERQALEDDFDKRRCTQPVEEE